MQQTLTPLDQGQADGRAAWGMQGPCISNTIEVGAGVRRPVGMDDWRPSGPVP